MNGLQHPDLSLPDPDGQFAFDFGPLQAPPPASFGTNYTPVSLAGVFSDNLRSWLTVRKEALLYFAEKQGAEVSIDFDGADPAFLPFEPIIASMTKGLASKPDILRPYSLSQGACNPQLFSEYAQSLSILPPKHFDPRHQGEFSELHFTTGLGATHLYRYALRELLEAGDVFMITAPTYGLFSLPPVLQNANVVTLKLEAEDNWKINPEKLEKRLREINAHVGQVKAFLHMNPHNPLGSVATTEDLAPLVPIFQAHNVFVIDDLTYHGLELGESQASAIASLEGMQDQTLTLISPSKSLGAAGLRGAFAVGPLDLIADICGKMTSAFEGVPITSQLGLAAAFCMRNGFEELRMRYLSANAAEYKRRKELMQALVLGFDSSPPETGQSALQSISECENRELGERAYRLLKTGIPKVELLHDPEAGYFQMLDFSRYAGATDGDDVIRSSMGMAVFLAKKAGVTVLPGEIMQYEGSELTARLSFALSRETIIEGICRIAEALAELGGKD